ERAERGDLAVGGQAEEALPADERVEAEAGLLPRAVVDRIQVDRHADVERALVGEGGPLRPARGAEPADVLVREAARAREARLRELQAREAVVDDQGRAGEVVEPAFLHDKAIDSSDLRRGRKAADHG